MTDEAISPLRRRMIEDMTIRKFTPKTQHDYVQRVKNFTAFLGRSPDTASFEDVRRYQLHLAASGVGVPTLNQTVSTLRFLFRGTLRRYEIVEHTHVIREPRKLPVVLSVAEVARLLDAAPGLKYKAALSVAYRAGLHAAEVVLLKVSDIAFSSREPVPTSLENALVADQVRSETKRCSKALPGTWSWRNRRVILEALNDFTLARRGQHHKGRSDQRTVSEIAARVVVQIGEGPLFHARFARRVASQKSCQASAAKIFLFIRMWNQEYGQPVPPRP